MVANEYIEEELCLALCLVCKFLEVMNSYCTFHLHQLMGGTPLVMHTKGPEIAAIEGFVRLFLKSLQYRSLSRSVLLAHANI